MTAADDGNLHFSDLLRIALCDATSNPFRWAAEQTLYLPARNRLAKQPFDETC